MIGPIARWIDWSVLQLGYLEQSPLDESNPRLEEAIAFLNGPDFIPTDSQPAKLALDDSRNFHLHEKIVWRRRRENRSASETQLTKHSTKLLSACSHRNRSSPKKISC